MRFARTQGGLGWVYQKPFGKEDDKVVDKVRWQEAKLNQPVRKDIELLM
jgi:hypothetical protein